MKKNKLAISLLKNEITTEEQALRKNPYPNSIKLSNDATLYYKNNIATQVKWMNFFFDGIQEKDKEKFITRSASAVIFYKVKVRENVTRLFAVCFGYGKNLLNAEALERRFGLLVVLTQLAAISSPFVK